MIVTMQSVIGGAIVKKFCCQTIQNQTYIFRQIYKYKICCLKICFFLHLYIREGGVNAR